MSPAEPPKIATWILTSFGCSPNNDAVIGDLHETYRQGRSRSWYWRQSLIALFAGWWTEVRAHIGPASAVIVISWIHLTVLSAVFRYLTRGAANPLTAYTFAHLLPFGWWGRNSVFWPVDLMLTWLPLFLISVFTGWLVSRIRRVHARPMILTCLVFTSLALVPAMYRVLVLWPREPLYFSVRGVVIPLQIILGISMGGGLVRISRIRMQSDRRSYMHRGVLLTFFVLAVVLGAALQAQAQFSIRAASDEPVDGWERIAFDNGTIWVSPEASLTSADILQAEPSRAGDGRMAVSVVLTETGGGKMRDLSIAQMNKRIGILLDGKLISAPRVRGEIGRQAMITGNGPSGLSAGDVERIVASVKAK